MITQSDVKGDLLYNEKSGVFVWRISRGKAIKGSVAGSLSRNEQYIRIGVRGVVYHAHRLAWLYVYGYMPENDIDHIDRDKLNNSISNLREASRSCNMINTGNKENNTSGVKGVVWHKEGGKWMTQITTKRDHRYVGLHKCFVEAVAHRLAAEQCLGWESCDSYSTAHVYMQEYLNGLKCQK